MAVSHLPGRVGIAHPPNRPSPAAAGPWPSAAPMDSTPPSHALRRRHGAHPDATPPAHPPRSAPGCSATAPGSRRWRSARQGVTPPCRTAGVARPAPPQSCCPGQCPVLSPPAHRAARDGDWPAAAAAGTACPASGDAAPRVPASAPLPAAHTPARTPRVGAAGYWPAARHPDCAETPSASPAAAAGPSAASRPATERPVPAASPQWPSASAPAPPTEWPAHWPPDRSTTRWKRRRSSAA